MNQRYNILVSICILIFSVITSTIAEENIVVPAQEKTATKREITADSLKWEYENQIAIFTGNVTMSAKEGDIAADKMTVFFNENDEITKIVAEGNAGLTREKQRCGGEIIEIYSSQDLIVLKQGAWISSGKTFFKGEEINFDTAKEIINITKGVKGEIQTNSPEKSMNEGTEAQSSKGTKNN